MTNLTPSVLMPSKEWNIQVSLSVYPRGSQIPLPRNPKLQTLSLLALKDPAAAAAIRQMPQHVRNSTSGVIHVGSGFRVQDGWEACGHGCLFRKKDCWRLQPFCKPYTLNPKPCSHSAEEEGHLSPWSQRTRGSRMFSSFYETAVSLGYGQLCPEPHV